MTRMPGSILLVGSIPLETPEEVFRACGKYVGPYVSCLPDGEVFPRTLWIGYLARYVYDGHPDVITDQALPTVREQGGGSGGHNPATKWRFRLRPGAGVPTFETGYADFALESYASFVKVRDEGAIPPGVRFQVCFPTTGAGFISYFEDPADWPAMTRAYQDAFGRDVARILERIPAGDLAIQLDFCPEIRDIQNALPWSPAGEGKLERWVDGVARQAEMVPDDVLLGLHWCYGTMGGWPMIRLDDLELCTQLTNTAVGKIGRPVDYVHMPVLRHAGDSYFAPLGGLAPGGAKLYLGLLHHTDDVATNMERIAMARKHLAGDLAADLGVASVCGYGRLSPEDTQRAFELHAAVGAELAGGH